MDNSPLTDTQPLVLPLQSQSVPGVAVRPAQRIEHVIRTYIQACNDADAAAIAACFCPEAVHYLPPPRLKWTGAATIGSHFAKIVREHGVCWTVDHLLVDVDRCAAALEWTRFDRHHAQSFVGSIGSSSNHRRGVFRKSVRTQRLPSIPTWHAKNSWILIMRGGAIQRRSLPITHHKKRAEDGCKHLDRRVMA